MFSETSPISAEYSRFSNVDCSVGRPKRAISRRTALQIGIGAGVVLANLAYKETASAEEPFIDLSIQPEPTPIDETLIPTEYPSLYFPKTGQIKGIEVQTVFATFSDYRQYAERLFDENVRERMRQISEATQPFYEQTLGLHVDLTKTFREENLLVLHTDTFETNDTGTLFQAAREHTPLSPTKGTFPVLLVVGLFPPEIQSRYPNHTLMQSKGGFNSDGTGHMYLRSLFVLNPKFAPTVLNHEIGHTLGFRHNRTNENNSIMTLDSKAFYNQEQPKGITPVDLAERVIDPRLLR